MDKTKMLLTGLLLGLLLSWVYYDGMERSKGQDEGYRVVSDTVLVYDTLRIYPPTLRDSVVVRYVTHRLPISETQALSVSSTSRMDDRPDVPRDSLKAVSVVDSVEVRIPLVQKVYQGERYRAYVSGYNPVLDSLQLYDRTRVVHVTERKPMSRLGIGVQLGYGVGLSRRPYLMPYIGVGVSYRLFSF